MGRLTIGFGAVLVLVGIAGYVSTGAASATALIPAFIGVPMVAAGWMIGRPNLQKIGLYSAIVLAAVDGGGCSGWRVRARTPSTCWTPSTPSPRGARSIT